jgi:hypothetical protein
MVESQHPSRYHAWLQKPSAGWCDLPSLTHQLDTHDTDPGVLALLEKLNRSLERLGQESRIRVQEQHVRSRRPGNSLVARGGKASIGAIADHCNRKVGL